MDEVWQMSNDEIEAKLLTLLSLINLPWPPNVIVCIPSHIGVLSLLLFRNFRIKLFFWNALKTHIFHIHCQSCIIFAVYFLSLLVQYCIMCYICNKYVPLMCDIYFLFICNYTNFLYIILWCTILCYCTCYIFILYRLFLCVYCMFIF